MINLPRLQALSESKSIDEEMDMGKFTEVMKRLFKRKVTKDSVDGFKVGKEKAMSKHAGTARDMIVIMQAGSSAIFSKDTVKQRTGMSLDDLAALLADCGIKKNSKLVLPTIG